MNCERCGSAIPDSSNVCVVCGQPRPRGAAFQEYQSGAAPQGEAAAPGEAEGGGENYWLLWRALALLVSVGLIIGGHTGSWVLKGTNSSAALIAVGFVVLALDVFFILAHFWNEGKEAEAEAAAAGRPLAAGTCFVAPGRTLLIVAAALMLVNFLFLLAFAIAEYEDYPGVLLCLELVTPPLFIALVLAAFQRRPWVLAILAALDLLCCILSMAYYPSALFALDAFVMAALLAFIAMTVAGRVPSNKPLLAAIAGAFLVQLVTLIVDFYEADAGIGLTLLYGLVMAIYFGAYYAAAAALRPQPQLASLACPQQALWPQPQQGPQSWPQQ
jgi:hypothetical protein